MTSKINDIYTVTWWRHGDEKWLTQFVCLQHASQKTRRVHPMPGLGKGWSTVVARLELAPMAGSQHGAGLECGAILYIAYVFAYMIMVRLIQKHKVT